MMDQHQLTQTLQQLVASGGADTAALEQRAKVGRLNFAAARYADRAGCDCDACCLLREASDLLVADVGKGVPAHAQSQHLAPRSPDPVDRAGPA